MAMSAQVTRRSFLAHTMAFATVGFAAADVLAGSDSPAASHDGPWQIGIYTRPWAKYDYRKAFDAMAEAGYKYAGLMTAKSKTGHVLTMENTVAEAQHVGQEAKQRGLQIISVYGGGFPMGTPQRGIDGLKRLIDNVAACGCGELMLGGTGGADLQEPYYRIVRDCCDYAAEKKVAITIKPHGGLNATGPQCRKRCETVGKKNFGLWYDPGNIFYYSDGKLDPVQDAATVDGLVRGISIKDYRSPKHVDVTPGTGEVNFPGVMARLKQGGFRSGPAVIECLAPGSNLKATVIEARRGREFVEHLLHG